MRLFIKLYSSASNRNQITNHLDQWVVIADRITNARRSAIDNGLSEIADNNCNLEFFGFWKDAYRMYLEYLRDEEIPETSKQIINARSEYCADLYGDPVHIYRSLRSTYDQALVNDRDDCLIRNRSQNKSTIRKSSGLQLYPNPAIENLDIRWDHGLGFNKIVIQDILGNKIREYPILELEINKSLDISNLRDGVYTITLLNEVDVNKESAIFIKAR
jgi:hypothetical protein